MMEYLISKENIRSAQDDSISAHDRTLELIQEETKES